MTLNFPKPAFSGQTYQIGESPYYIFNGNYWEIDKSYVVNGSSGTSGSSGLSGSNGTSGTSGVNGSSGTSGSSGSNGSSGTSGSNGSSGTSGTSGSNGSSGTSGSSGSSGLVTLTGSTTGGIITYNGSGTNATVQSGVTYSGTTLTISGSLVITGSTNSVNNRLTNLENSVITGSVNYLQVLGNQRNGITSAGTSIISGSITTTGRPVQIMVTGDANPTSGGGLWCSLQIYRDGNGIGNTLQLEAANNNENQAYCLNVIDTPEAGTYTYSLRVPTIVGTFQFGEVSGPLLTAIELSSNTTIRNTNNTFSGTNTFTGQLNVSNGVGSGGSLEGGEIDLQYASSTTLTGSNVVFDVYQDRVRIFEGGGNNRGVYVDLSKAPAGVGGELLWKASGLVNRGVDVTLGNLKVRMASSGNASLQVSTVSGTYSVYGSSISNYGTVGGISITDNAPVTITTTPEYLNVGYNFLLGGYTDTWNIMDTSKSIAWRITLIVGSGYNNNMISIERLH
jgi:hypothetical protein